jgi:hypothetical protein
LKGEDLPANRLREIHDDELLLVEEIILATFVDDAKKVVLRGSGIGQNAIHFAED